jgi:hypothetical protein
MNALASCPKCSGEIPDRSTICPSCGWDSTTAIARPERPSLLAILRGGAWRLVVYGLLASLPFVVFMRVRATGPGPDLVTTTKWIVAGDSGRSEELVTIHRAHEIATSAARYAVQNLNAPDFDGDWAETLGPFATMHVRGWMPLLFYGATSDMAPASVRTFYDVRATDGWGRPFRIERRLLMRTDGWADDEELATDITAGLQSSFFGTFLTELDEERDWMRIAIVSAGADGDLETGDDLRFISYIPVGMTIRLRGNTNRLERDLERAYTQGRHHFRIEGNQWDLIDARLLAEFRLEYLP